MEKNTNHCHKILRNIFTDNSTISISLPIDCLLIFLTHPNHRAKVIQNLKDLLNKLKNPSEEVKKALDSLNEELKKQKGQCESVNAHRSKYVSALKNIDQAESNMRYADQVIAKYEGQKTTYSKKVKEFEKLVNTHVKTIKTHVSKKDAVEKTRDICLKSKEEHVEFTAKYKTCTGKLNPLKTDYKVCSTSRTSASTKNAALEKSIHSLEKKVQQLNGENSKWKNLAEQYKPKTPGADAAKDEDPAQPITRYTGAHHICRASGDPHYLALNADNTPRKANYDVYNQEGDFLLFRSPDNEFEVQTRLAYTKQWGMHSSQSAVAVRADGNVIESYGGDNFKINGQREVIPAGHSKTLKGGVIVRCSQRNTNIQTYTISEPDGGIITFSAVKLPEGVYYHNIVLHSPVAWSKIAKGLCVFPVRSVEKVLQLRTDNKPGLHIFGTAYVSDNKNHASSKVEWKNGKLKEDAENFCFNILHRRGELFHDCCLDAKISGSLEVLKGYAAQNENIDKMMNIEDDQNKTPLGRGYHILSRVLRALATTQKDMETHNVVKLIASAGVPTYQQKVSEIMKRLDREIDTVRAVNAELGKRFAA
eukprot:CAMPEP_0117435426 /NCGR_PEP_ID=MMETSP0759-20121206/475_1 /TAXON_ID=63605 /ORGANISM="Percolomonas cosmopolitus, Strain WS" /LENGTH=590 /DNA_ID=CAMNT_0005226973 /DNA_START=245 /DNA_END=2018 /DNA_ORIENTATION=+